MASKLDGKFLQVEFEDATFRVPLWVVARSRAENYADEFGNDLNRSLDEDTIPLFLEGTYEATDWAASNMNWSDLAVHATRIEKPPRLINREHAYLSAGLSIVSEAP